MNATLLIIKTEFGYRNEEEWKQMRYNRHIHIDYCRSEDPSACSGTDIQHITSDLHPNPDRAKDFTSHALHWRRKGDLCLIRLRRVLY